MKRKMTDETRDKIYFLNAKGCSVKEIAELIECGESIVCVVLKMAYHATHDEQEKAQKLGQNGHEPVYRWAVKKFQKNWELELPKKERKKKVQTEPFATAVLEVETAGTNGECAAKKNESRVVETLLALLAEIVKTNEILKKLI